MSGLRDVVLVAVLAGLVPASFFRPWVGVLGWFWIAYMVPHSLTWGFGRTLPLAAMVGGATLLGFFFSRDRKPLPRSWSVFFLLAFAGDIVVSTVLGYDPALSLGKLDWVGKGLLMTFVTMCLFQDRTRLRYLYLVPAASLGFHGLKSGLWVIRTGGGSLLWGPDSSFFADNNTFGLALCMSLPLILYLAREESRLWVKRVLHIAFGFTVLAIPFTYSRGAFIGLLIVLGILVWRSPRRLQFTLAVVLAAFMLVPLAPERLQNRIASILAQDSAETRDNSAAGRLEAWETAWNIAVTHPFFGEGFRVLWNDAVWDRFYGRTYLAARDAHSLYFEVLAEHGLLGFAIYLGILVSTLWSLRCIRKRWRGHPEHGYLSHYAEMTQLALYPYLVAGAFLGVAYFDLYFLLVGTSAVLHTLSLQAETAPTAAPPAPELMVSSSRHLETRQKRRSR
jgi:probable O-glycosylation ligase (exosortase A-associated)